MPRVIPMVRHANGAVAARLHSRAELARLLDAPGRLHGSQPVGEEEVTMHSWQLQDARNRLGRLVEDAVQDGPQVITRRGVEPVVVLSVEEYRALRRRQTDLVDFFRASPLAGSGIDFERRDEYGRPFEPGAIGSTPA